MLLTFEATFHNKQLILMNRPFQLGSSWFLTLKGDNMPFLHQHTSYCKPTCVGVYLKWFGKVQILKNKQCRKFFFQHPKRLFLLLSPLEWQLLIEEVSEGFDQCRKSCYELHVKVCQFFKWSDSFSHHQNFAIPWRLGPFSNLALCLPRTTHVPISPSPLGQFHSLPC